jgi:hypothetical protein
MYTYVAGASMPNIRIVFAQDDAAHATRIAAAIAQEGLAADTGAQAAGAALVDAIARSKAVIVLWSTAALSSPTVRGEAGLALARGKLVQASLDGVAPPAGFAGQACHSLAQWSGDQSDPGWRALAEAARNLAGTAASPDPPPGRQGRSAAAPDPPRGARQPAPAQLSVAVPLLLVAVAVLLVALLFVLFVGVPERVPLLSRLAGSAEMDAPQAANSDPAIIAAGQASASASAPAGPGTSADIPSMDELFGGARPAAPRENRPARNNATTWPGKTPLVSGALPVPPGGRYPELIMPTSQTQRLTMADLAGLDRAQLRVARNEIFARRGRTFNDPALRAHFSLYPWYSPRGEGEPLSDVESANVALMLEAERQGGVP